MTGSTPIAAPDADALFAAQAATWPAARTQRLGPWTLRDGQGGGKRASAATAQGQAIGPSDITTAESAMRHMGQTPLFLLRPDCRPVDAALDKSLADAGYDRIDASCIYIAPVARLAPESLPVMQVMAIWPPLAIQNELWTEEGIGPARRAVMARAQGPRTALMARQADRVAGTAFIAVQGPVAMLHAMVVTASQRRRGAARNLTRGAAEWATTQGAQWLALSVTMANQPARLLYEGLGMEPAAQYHYRSR